ncbi:MAG: hypothetical protein KUL81_16180 [Azonexus sp.]|nr:hypothetical protein [Azonexus sp.]
MQAILASAGIVGARCFMKSESAIFRVPELHEICRPAPEEADMPLYCSWSLRR